jgi:propanol-preferring alcohol dehydrogenase
MKALRLRRFGEAPQLEDVLLRSPGRGEVVLDVLAAGVCHSDLHVIDGAGGRLPYRPPFTLGHEVAGRVAAVGPDVTGVFRVGQSVVVYGPWGCGRCQRCLSGSENYCDRKTELRASGIGLGVDGGMAEALVVAASRLVDIGGLDPAAAAPLTDAGLTTFHAVARSRERLGDGRVAVVIGVGGLGHLAVQILRACAACRVVAVDTQPAALELAERSGAHVAAYAGSDAVAAVTAAGGGRGADVIFDFVGADDTLAFAVQVLRTDGEVVLVGSGGGVLAVTKPAALPHGARVSLPFWGTRPELVDVVRLAREGLLHVETTTFALVEAPDALDLLRRGRVHGRAVLVPA